MGKMFLFLLSVSAGILAEYYMLPTAPPPRHALPPLSLARILSVDTPAKLITFKTVRGNIIQVHIPPSVSLSTRRYYVSGEGSIYFTDTVPDTYTTSSLYPGQRAFISFMPVDNRLDATRIVLSEYITP